MGSLLVGLSCAKSIALVYGKRLIGINHLEAHAYAGVFAGMQYGADHIALVVSGGHTSLLEYRDRRFRLLGRTVDDAAGEAYDKIAKILNLGYPGGPVIDRIARQGDPGIYRFPRPMLDRDNFNFSFSGLKTAVAYYMHHHPGTATSDLCAAFQEAVVDVLVTKTIEAAKKFKHQTIAVTGGVASNSRLRGEFSDRATSEGIRVFIPAPVFCTDNAAMVAGLAYWKLEQGDCSGLDLGVSSDSGFAIDPSI